MLVLCVRRAARKTSIRKQEALNGKKLKIFQPAVFAPRPILKQNRPLQEPDFSWQHFMEM